MAGRTLDPAPALQPLIQGKPGTLDARWYVWLVQQIVARLQQSVANVLSLPVALIAQVAAIPSTTLYTPTMAGLYRVSAYVRVTQAATVSSSVAVTVTWTDGGNACSATLLAALTGNTIATVGSGALLIRSDSGQPIKYSTAYASVGATVMQHRLDLTVEQVQ